LLDETVPSNERVRLVNWRESEVQGVEFKDAISKMTRNELIGILCDIYYAHGNAKGGCECDCGCGSGSESKKTPKRPKAKVSKKK